MSKIEVEVKAQVFEADEDESIERQVISKAADILVERLSKDAAQKVSALVEARVGDQLTEMVARVIEEGIKETNSYGQPTGKTITVRGLVMDRLSSMLKPKDSSYERKAGEIERQAASMIDEAVKQFLAKEIVGELNGVKVQLKEKLTAAVLGNLQQQVSAVIAGR